MPVYILDSPDRLTEPIQSVLIKYLCFESVDFVPITFHPQDKTVIYICTSIFCAVTICISKRLFVFDNETRRPKLSN